MVQLWIGRSYMVFDPDTIIAVAKELKEAKERVKFLEDKLRSMGVGQEPRLVAPAPSQELSMPERIINLLGMNLNMVFSFEDVYRNINADNEPYIRSLLSRMVKEGKIESRGWGKYGAVSEKEKPKAS